MRLPSHIINFHDTSLNRKRIFKKALSAFKDALKYKGRNIDLEVSNLKIDDKDIPISVQKKHLLEERDLTVPLKGKIKLKDKSGKVLEERTQTIAQIPYYTGRGTFISGGNDYAAVNQFRLRPGVYARRKVTGELESHFNLQHGSGLGFRAFFEPETGVFRLNVGQANIKLYPILRSMGVRDSDIKKYWGKEITEINSKFKGERPIIKRFYDKLLGWDAVPNLTVSEMGREIKKSLAKAKMEPLVNEKTLGHGYANVSPKVLLTATKKLLDINKGKAEIDDRDSVAFRKLYDVSDFLAEKVVKDAGKVRRKLFNKLERDKSLRAFVPGYFTKQVKGVVTTDSKIQPIEEINPLELYDYQERIVSMGEGGIADIEAIPEESRNVHPSQLGLVDPIRGPESMTVGVDVRATSNTFKGENGLLYAKVLDKKGNQVLASSEKLAFSNVAFPNQLNKRSDIKVIDKDGEISSVKRDQVDYWLINGQDMFSHVTNIIPGVNSTEGRRLLMGSKFQTQALPLIEGEYPVVANRVPGKDYSYEKKIGRVIGGRLAKVDGKITKITKDDIYIRDDQGKVHRHGLYNNFSFNRKSYIHQTPLVKVGDRVKKDQVLAKSNYTDKDGNLVLGKNLITAYMPYKGYSVDDGIVISETAAKKLTADLMTTVSKEYGEDVIKGREQYVSRMPAAFTKDQLKHIDDDGIVKPGAKLNEGDPVIVSLKKKPLSAADLMIGKLHKSLKGMVADNSITWDKHTEGEVVDVVKTRKGVNVTIKTKVPAIESDKIANRYGGKGVIGKILPDSEMPVIKSTGQKVEVLFNPTGVPSRVNPFQVYETLLGKIYDRTGKRYLLDPFSTEEDRVSFVKKELKKHKIPDTEELIDPSTGKPFQNKILVGKQFFTKSFKTSDAGFSAREIGKYTADERPAKGGKEGSKLIGTFLINALLGHGAVHNLREMSVLKGTKNTEFWKAMKLGLPLPTPDVPFMYKKFEDYLKGSGINLHKNGYETRLLPMTRTDVNDMAGLEIKNDKLLKAKNLEPEKGGLFDFAITGGPIGMKWSHVKLSEEMPNPVMEEPIRRILEVTGKQYENIIARGGGKEVKKLLDNVDIKKEIRKLKKVIKSDKKSLRNNAVKRLGVLHTLDKFNIKPSELVLNKWPVIPPQFRPISVVGGGKTVIVSSPNLLYKDLIQTNTALKELKQDIDDISEERLGLYKAMKAVAGIGDPVNIKTKNKNAKGFIQEIIGDTAKRGMFQYKVLAKAQDLSGRAVALPDPTLNIDQVGIPEDTLWTIYKPFIMRRLVRKGIPLLKADEYIEDKHITARHALEDEIKERPVMIDRAPSLHKFSIMAVYPQPRKDKSLGFPVLIAPGFNADFDGDQLNINVPVTEEARLEAINKMLPSRNLFSIKEHEVLITPQQEAGLGIHYASMTPSKKRPLEFKNYNEALQAYNHGRIKINDPVKIKGT